MLSREYILDLGIGAGGPYIEETRRTNVIRVGVDKFWYGLRMVRKTYKDVETVEGNVWEGILPFKSGSISNVEIYFPLDEMLLFLTNSDSPLWTKFKRVLTPQGGIKIVIDEPGVHKQGICVQNEPQFLDFPALKVIEAAKKSGFNVKKKNLSIGEVSLLGTDSAETAAFQMQDVFSTCVYEITASIPSGISL